MNEPFTDATRQAFREWAESVMSSHPLQSERDQAIAYLCYEASLQRQDAQIAALTIVCSQLYAAFYDEPRAGFFTEHQVHALARAKTAIKEATDATS